MLPCTELRFEPPISALYHLSQSCPTGDSIILCFYVLCYFDGPYALSAQTFFFFFVYFTEFLLILAKENANTPQASCVHTLCTSTPASQPAACRALFALSKLIIATNVASSLVPRSRRRVLKLESGTK